MRIIGGEKRGRRLVEWEESGIRPMRDFVRTALFNILEDFVPDAAFLDLFCGTGSVGLEALSRGAAQCTFVDRSREACAIVRRNLDSLDLMTRGEVIVGDVLDVLERFSRHARIYDLVFVGPPYYQSLVPCTLERLADGRILGQDAVVIAEVHASEGTEAQYGTLALVDQRRYGDNRLIFYRTTGGKAQGEGDG